MIILKTDEELDAEDCSKHRCNYFGCTEPGDPTIITALWNYYHKTCYEKRQRQIWGPKQVKEKTRHA